MRQLLRIFMAGVLSLAALTLGTGTSWAGPTAVQYGGPAAYFPYGGNIQATLLAPYTLVNTFGTTTCTVSTLGGTVTPTGSPLNITSVVYDDPCGTPHPPGAWVTHIHPPPPPPPPPGPWPYNYLTYDPVSGHDFTITMPHFAIQAVYDTAGGITCNYAGTLNGVGYNANNPAAPYGINQAELFFNHASVPLVTATSSASCPTTGFITAIYKLMGQSSGGTFNQTLRVTL